MGKEQITIEVDAALMEKLRAAGLDPIQYVERLLARQAVAQETEIEREARWAALRAEMKPGMDAYDAFIEANGLWSDGLRHKCVNSTCSKTPIGPPELAHRTSSYSKANPPSAHTLSSWRRLRAEVLHRPTIVSLCR